MKPGTKRSADQQQPREGEQDRAKAARGSDLASLMEIRHEARPLRPGGPMLSLPQNQQKPERIACISVDDSTGNLLTVADEGVLVNGTSYEGPLSGITIYSPDWDLVPPAQSYASGVYVGEQRYAKLLRDSSRGVNYYVRKVTAAYLCSREWSIWLLGHVVAAVYGESESTGSRELGFGLLRLWIDKSGRRVFTPLPALGVNHEKPIEHEMVTSCAMLARGKHLHVALTVKHVAAAIFTVPLSLGEADPPQQQRLPPLDAAPPKEIAVHLIGPARMPFDGSNIVREPNPWYGKWSGKVYNEGQEPFSRVVKEYYVAGGLNGNGAPPPSVRRISSLVPTDIGSSESFALCFTADSTLYDRKRDKYHFCVMRLAYRPDLRELVLKEGALNPEGEYHTEDGDVRTGRASIFNGALRECSEYFSIWVNPQDPYAGFLYALSNHTGETGKPRRVVCAGYDASDRKGSWKWRLFSFRGVDGKYRDPRNEDDDEPSERDDDSGSQESPNEELMNSIAEEFRGQSTLSFVHVDRTSRRVLCASEGVRVRLVEYIDAEEYPRLRLDFDRQCSELRAPLAVRRMSWRTLCALKYAYAEQIDSVLGRVIGSALETLYASRSLRDCSCSYVCIARNRDTNVTRIVGVMFLHAFPEAIGARLEGVRSPEAPSPFFPRDGLEVVYLGTELPGEIRGITGPLPAGSPGAGELLIATAKMLAYRLGMSRVNLESVPDAAAFYVKMGFTSAAGRTFDTFLSTIDANIKQREVSAVMPPDQFEQYAAHSAIMLQHRLPAPVGRPYPEPGGDVYNDEKFGTIAIASVYGSLLAFSCLVDAPRYSIALSTDKGSSRDAFPREMYSIPLSAGGRPRVTDMLNVGASLVP